MGIWECLNVFVEVVGEQCFSRQSCLLETRLH